jgi:hypothetical protein
MKDNEKFCTKFQEFLHQSPEAIKEMKEKFLVIKILKLLVV